MTIQGGSRVGTPLLTRSTRLPTLRAMMPILHGRTTLVAAMLTLWTALATAQDTGGAGQGVLLLRNGQMLEGRIVRTEDHYQVNLPDGEIRVRACDVELCCQTLEEGYQRKRAAIQVSNAQDHLQLAQWCERHGLYKFAANELADAAAIEPNHPMLGVLRRRLEMDLEPPQQPLEPSGPIEKVPSAEDLDRLTRGMPPGSMEMFTQTVQPLLMNYCMTSGCHGPQSQTKLRLMRAPMNQPPGRRITQRNLHAVLQEIDYANPSASRLLTAICASHGPVKAAIFTDRQAGQYRRILDWVNLVTQQQQQPIAPELPPSVVVRRKRKPAFMPAKPPAPRLLSHSSGHAHPLGRPGQDEKAGAVRPASNTSGENLPPSFPNPKAIPPKPAQNGPRTAPKHARCRARRRLRRSIRSGSLQSPAGSGERVIWPLSINSKKARLLASRAGNWAISAGVYQWIDATSAGLGIGRAAWSKSASHQANSTFHAVTQCQSLRTGRTSTPISSRISRIKAASSDSPSSMPPPGKQ